MTSLAQGSQTPAGWVAKDQRIVSLGTCMEKCWSPSVGATDSCRLFHWGTRLRSSGIVPEVLGVGPGGVFMVKARTPKRFRLHKSIL